MGELPSPGLSLPSLLAAATPREAAYILSGELLAELALEPSTEEASDALKEGELIG